MKKRSGTTAPTSLLPACKHVPHSLLRQVAWSMPSIRRYHLLSRLPTALWPRVLACIHAGQGPSRRSILHLTGAMPAKTLLSRLERGLEEQHTPRRRHHGQQIATLGSLHPPRAPLFNPLPPCTSGSWQLTHQTKQREQSNLCSMHGLHAFLCWRSLKPTSQPSSR